MSSFFLPRFGLAKEAFRIIEKDLNYIQSCGYAARKGTREKKRRNKVKVEVKKVGFIPHNLRDKGRSKGPFVSRRLDDSFRGLPLDDVYPSRFYQWKTYSFATALECHRESHHPQQYNLPSAPLQAFIELDLTGPKKTKFVEPFTRISPVSEPFDHGEERSILVFCKTPEMKSAAESAGATLVGDVDMIKKTEKGELMLPDFQFVLAHPNILPELVCLRGLMRKKFPNPKLGTLGPNIGEMVARFRSGIQYTLNRDEAELSYGWVDATIGRLDMDPASLEKNLKFLIDDILSMKPKRPGPFITRLLLKSPPSGERLKLDLSEFLEAPEEESDSDSDDEAVRARA